VYLTQERQIEIDEFLRSFPDGGATSKSKSLVVPVGIVKSNDGCVVATATLKSYRGPRNVSGMMKKPRISLSGLGIQRSLTATRTRKR